MISSDLIISHNKKFTLFFSNLAIETKTQEGKTNVSNKVSDRSVKCVSETESWCPSQWCIQNLKTWDLPKCL